MDTSPDFSGENVNPQIIENYDGKAIQLNDRIELHLKHILNYLTILVMTL